MIILSTCLLAVLRVSYLQWRLFPTVEHRYCVKHIYYNFKVNHKGVELKSVLWRCAGITSLREFERGMQYIKTLDEEAWKYLANIDPAQWTRFHFSPKALTNCLVNNLSEKIGRAHV